jgi:hypothetical protein
VEISSCISSNYLESGLPPQSGNWQIHNKDAWDFVFEDCKNQYNWIVLDMASRDDVPAFVWEDEFLDRLANHCLAPHGTVLFNALGTVDEDFKDKVFNLHRYFANLHTIPGGFYNRVIVAYNHNYIPTTASLLGRLYKLPSECNLPVLRKGIAYQYYLDFSTPESTEKALNSFDFEIRDVVGLPTCAGVEKFIYG